MRVCVCVYTCLYTHIFQSCDACAPVCEKRKITIHICVCACVCERHEYIYISCSPAMPVLSYVEKNTTHYMCVSVCVRVYT